MTSLVEIGQGCGGPSLPRPLYKECFVQVMGSRFLTRLVLAKAVSPLRFATAVHDAAGHWGTAEGRPGRLQGV